MTQQESILPLRLPEKLYGRGIEVAQLLTAFERAADRHPQFVLISGEPGVGKTSLVDELRRPVRELRGFFISGKFEQFAQHKPLSAMLEALDSLATQLSLLEAEQKQAWAQRITRRLHGSVAVLVDLVPAMAEILGEQPQPQVLEPEQTRHRMQTVFLNTLRAVSDGDFTLVLFLDDLQWADPATFELEKLLLRQEAARILIIGAYRDTEVDENHSLTRIRETQRSASGDTALPLTEIDLLPLSGFDLNNLLKEMLGTGGIALRELAMLCQDRTGGNPFHILQFLLTMHGEKLLRYDRKENAWSWNLDRIEELPSTGNIIDLLTRRIDLMGEEVRQALTVAACFGSRFQVTDFLKLPFESTEVHAG